MNRTERELQPIKFVTLTRVTNNASCNWVNFVQVSSVQFVNTPSQFRSPISPLTAAAAAAARDENNNDDRIMTTMRMLSYHYYTG